MSLIPGISSQPTQMIDGMQVDSIAPITAGNGIPLPGRTNGNAVASGMVGEVRSFTSRSATTAVNGIWVYNATPLDTLTTGIWCVYATLSIPGVTSMTAAGCGINTTGSGSPIYQNFIAYNPSTLGSGYSHVAPMTSFIINTATSQAIYMACISIGAIGMVGTITGFSVRIA